MGYRKLFYVILVVFSLHSGFARAPLAQASDTVLVTGGAGYIGSHTVHQLHDAGERVIVLDNLYSGHTWAVPEGVELIIGNCGDSDLVSKLIEKYSIKSVIHFAAHIEVGEANLDPIKYYKNNFVNTLSLIENCDRLGVEHFIFSSTCAVYGESEIPVCETTQTHPINAYSRSKLASEWVLEDLAKSKGTHLNYVILRYFNVAGAKVAGGLGQSTPRATSLIKVAAEAASGKRERMHIFGDHHPTPDGTCIRDFIHVDDLAHTHILALNYLRDGGKSDLFNCGNGQGYSVREVVDTMKKTSGVDFKVEIGPTRPDDIVASFANPTKVKTVLGLKPQYDDLSVICKTAYDWELEAERRNL